MEKKSFWKELFENVIAIILVIGISLFIITYIGQRTQVCGSSMEPTLQDGDNLISDKVSYRFRDPKRFEIIVFPVGNCDTEKGNFYIKRIIGLPGETVFIDENGVIYINGEVLEEDFGKEVIFSSNRGRAQNEIVLGEDEYFVLGDNRNNSQDSRSEVVGNVKRDEINSRVWVRFYPFSKFGFLKNK